MEQDQLVVLHYVHPVKNSAAHVAQALEGVKAIAQDGDGFVAWYEFMHQIVIGSLAQHISAHRGRGDICVIQVGEGITFMSGRERFGGVVNHQPFGLTGEGFGDHRAVTLRRRIAPLPVRVCQVAGWK